MRERTCAYCGERIEGMHMEIRVSIIDWQNSSMKKVDLHPECFDTVWSKCKLKGEGNEVRTEKCEDGLGHGEVLP